MVSARRVGMIHGSHSQKRVAFLIWEEGRRGNVVKGYASAAVGLGKDGVLQNIANKQRACNT